ncbi:MAG: bifunctional phosphoribosylaminoimidazolecarboxamide formyltransferase/IMP cyclohydrolase [Propionibacteriaceae bacterium]|jgi:phosphoribosylaminoimidazolecarboxamide formyltransferase/IMP cyclohydrolase|nr:bifunctional phosphoribosylaminoimidazolecarboxamide formyltransferase/IMP cyclohydrolase [Propionibacteriaceae bacterium]
MSELAIRRALVSVYDKTGLVELGQELAQAGVELVSTGSTAATLAEAGVPVTPVEAVTGFPECLDGRVKTLHPKIHAGILADRRLESHVQQLAELGIDAFDLVVSNLYPFTATVASGASIGECVEQIDIGGPSMVRAAAKNHPSVAIITSPAQYPLVSEALANGGFSPEQRQRLAAVAFAHTAAYDVAVASWMGAQFSGTSAADGFPAWLGYTWDKAFTLRYGENSHQRAALYQSSERWGLGAAEQLHGKEMSYNNFTDADAAYRAAYDFAEPCVAIIKHANPCGIAVGDDIAAAHRKAHACDPVSAYGGVVAANRPLSVEAAEQIAEIFTEVVLAPDFQPGALEILTRKKNLRILRVDGYPHGRKQADSWRELRPISGGLLVQDADQLDAPGDDWHNWQLVSGEAADERTLADLRFAWRACRCVKSNAILLARDAASVGVGMGQVNRVDSCRLAVERAGDRAAGSVAASDAFFPFADGPQILIDAGVRAIVQPGGSVRDQDTITAAQAAGVTMYLTGTRHFFH